MNESTVTCVTTNHLLLLCTWASKNNNGVRAKGKLG